MSEGKTVSQSRVTLTQLMGVTEANTIGNVHGGFIMKLCDEAGGMAATRHARRPAVTVTVDSMNFHSPVHIGNLLTVTAEVTLDESGRPVRVPPLICETEEERQRFERAAARQAQRLERRRQDSG
jgi:acyl-CoA hydrolase